MRFRNYKQLFAFGLGMWAVLLLKFLAANTGFNPFMDLILIVIATLYLVIGTITYYEEERSDGF